MKIVAIIQARMGSSRLPGKVLADIEGKCMLDRVIERTSAAKLVDKVVVATTTAPEDEALVEHLKNHKQCGVFRGSVDDVLSRFYECAKLYEADIVVRITADDPLKDPQIIDKAINLLNVNPGLDYCSNTIEPSYPEGLDVEAVRFKALERAYFEARLASERKHVTPYIWKNTELFKVYNFKSDKDLNGWRWTVDRNEDLVFMRHVFKKFNQQPLVPYQDVIAWLEENPEIRLINAGINRNEGYKKSIELES